MEQVQEFNKTLDFSVLSKNVVEEYRRQAEGMEHSTPISRIVLNHFSISNLQPLPQYMIGPIYYSVLTYGNKKFYLFGDVHNSRTQDFKCYSPMEIDKKELDVLNSKITIELESEREKFREKAIEEMEEREKLGLHLPPGKTKEQVIEEQIEDKITQEKEIGMRDEMKTLEEERGHVKYFHKEVPTYLGKLDKIVDIFYEGEEEHLKRNQLKYPSYRLKKGGEFLSSFGRELMGCEPTFRTKELCKFDNIRFHLVDIRRLEKNERKDELGSIISYISELFAKNFSSMGSARKEMKELQMSINIMFERQSFNAAFKAYIEKQLANIKDSGASLPHEVRSADSHVFEILSNEYNATTNKLMEDMARIRDTDFSKKSFDDVREFLGEIAGTTIMDLQDIYFLARCFRKFRDVERHGFRGYPCTNIVGWFGVEHVKKIIIKLEKIGATLVVESGDKNPKGRMFECPDYRLIQNPWFL
jgi:hypothetical protein